MEYKSIYESEFGRIILTSDGKYLTGLCFTTSRFKQLLEIKEEQINDELKIFKITKNWLDRYFQNERPDLNEVPIKLVGSEFMIEVLEILKTIPYKKTATYGDIAKTLAKKKNISKMSSQAVGHAIGQNPISIIIPCHRVVGANGNLTGYGGGIDLKIKLLEHEGIDVKKFFIPKKGNAL